MRNIKRQSVVCYTEGMRDSVKIKGSDGAFYSLSLNGLSFDNSGRVVGKVIDTFGEKQSAALLLKFSDFSQPVWVYKINCKDVAETKDSDISLKFNVWHDGVLRKAYISSSKKGEDNHARVNVEGKLVRMKIRQDSEGKLYGEAIDKGHN